MWGQIEAVFDISKWLATNFLPEVIGEVEYTRKIAMSISDILSIWSMP